jgi:hypothetical protein
LFRSFFLFLILHSPPQKLPARLDNNKQHPHKGEGSEFAGKAGWPNMGL